MDRNQSLFGPLPLELIDDLYTLNPHWAGKPGPQTPPFRRWAYDRVYRNLKAGLTPAIVLRGPRRVGKTILVRHVMEGLIADGVTPDCIVYVAFDEIRSLEKIKDPILAIARWFEKQVLKRTFNEIGREGGKAYLLFDEVQNLEAWAPQVKHLVDNHDVRILVTGSSSLRIESGRDSLAGRITTLDLGPLVLREIAAIRYGIQTTPYWGDDGLDKLLQPDYWQEGKRKSEEEADIRLKAFKAFSDNGAYPIAHNFPDVSWQELADNLNETVIKRAIQHDLRMGSKGQKRDEKLLEEVFRLCCRYAGQTPGQSVFVPEIQQALSGNIGWNRILNYLKFLDGALLIRLVQPLELRLKKRKSPPKICLCDHSLRASWLQEVIPLDTEGLAANPHLTDLAGYLAESVLGYFLGSIPGLDIAYFPARGIEPEVDFVITIGTRRIPVEVKYRRKIDSHDDTRGIRAFLEKTVYNAPFGILVTFEDDVEVLDPRIIPISLSSFLWLR